MSQFSNKKYDLEERTAKLGETVIDFCKKVKKDSVSEPLIKQLVRSATSIGANYKESQETKHWLRMLARALPDNKVEVRLLWQEAQELTMIFQKITSSLQR